MHNNSDWMQEKQFDWIFYINAWMLWISFEAISGTVLFLHRTTTEAVFSTVLTQNKSAGQQGSTVERIRPDFLASRDCLPNDGLQDKYEAVILVWRIFSGCLSRKCQSSVCFRLELRLWKTSALNLYFQDFLIGFSSLYLTKTVSRRRRGADLQRMSWAWTTLKCRSGFT